MATSTPAVKSRPLATLEARARHVLLMIGFGFAAYVLGAIFSSFLLIRLQDRVEALEGTPRAVAASLVEHFWILVVWPVVANGLTRIFPLSPWPLALIGAATGEAFSLGIAVASRGLDEAFAEGLQLALHVGLMGAGVGLTVWAANRGKAAAARAELAAQQKAEAKKGEYDEFVRASEAIAARTESKEAAGQSAPESGASAAAGAESKDAPKQGASASQPVAAAQTSAGSKDAADQGTSAPQPGAPAAAVEHAPPVVAPAAGAGAEGSGAAAPSDSAAALATGELPAKPE